MKYTFLTENFYNDYPHECYPQIEQKTDRPYVHIKIDVYGTSFAVPLRSNIDHPHAFMTNKNARCGVDFSKAIVITKSTYLDMNRKPHIRPEEFRKLKGKEHRLEKMLENYINLYKKAKVHETIKHRDSILKYSTMQYFEKYISIDNNPLENSESKNIMATQEAAATIEENKQT